MEMFLYKPAEDRASDKVEDVVKGLSDGSRVEVFGRIDNLKERLKKPVDGDGLAVLIAPQKDDLLDLVSINYLLEKVRNVLVIADRSEEAVSMAHRLKPRYLAYMDSELDTLSAVIGKMTGRGNGG